MSITGAAATWCPQCGRVFDNNAKTCTSCVVMGRSVELVRGETPAPPGMWQCANCGLWRMDGETYCVSCRMVRRTGTSAAEAITTGKGQTMSTGYGALPVSKRTLKGCLFEARPAAAPLFRPPPGSAPDRIDLRQYCSPVEDQGQTSSCTANAVAGALEYHQNRMGGGLKDISRLFVYYNARRMADMEGQDSGCFIHHAMAGVLAYGACEESIWPFDARQITKRPHEQAYSNAMQNEAIQYARTPLGGSAIQVLAAGLPVVFGTYLPQRFYAEAERSGVMPAPAEQVEPPAGGHAMLIVGYDLPSKMWLVRNSWGTGWGDGGYVRIPFASLEAYSLPDHFWTIGAIEKAAPGALRGAPVQASVMATQRDAPFEAREALARLSGKDGRAGSGEGDPRKLGGQACYQCGIIYDNYATKCAKCWGSLEPYNAKAGESSSSQGDAAHPRGYSGAPLPVSARRLDGCLLETRVSNAPVLRAPLGNVPEKMDLRQYCSPVEDQGQSNSCTANAIVGSLEYHQRRQQSGGHTDLSRLFVYYNARQLANAQGEDCGSFIHHVMASVLAHGACDENIWPFDLSRVLQQPSQQAYKDAMNNEAIQYARTPLGQSALQAVGAGLPVVFGTYIPSRFYDEAAKTGLMPGPAERLDPPGGGHAMLIVGYDLPSKTWLVRNSWGPGWADGGYVRIPFDTLGAYSMPDHFWTVGAIEGRQGLSLSGPTPAAAAQATRAGAAEELREALSRLRGELRSDFQSELDRQKADIRNRLRNP